MKIDLNTIDQDQFIMRKGMVAGEECNLVFPPHNMVEWNKRNLIFRSSIWNSEGELISASFPKFFNWGEKSELGYTPFSTTANGGISCMEKMDGSTLIVSKYKGQLITRTRGTFDACILDNGHEIGMLMEKYPEAFDLEEDKDGTCPYSIIFEWESPDNVIVLNHPEVDIVLIGKIYHEDYRFETQRNLDALAEELGVRRPRVFKYAKIKEMLEDVVTWIGTEGLCVYANKDQSIRKVKSEWYLALHRMKSELGSFKRVVDAFFVMETPSYTDFYNQIGEIYDWEIAQRCIPHISIIADGWKEVNTIVSSMQNFIETRLLPLGNRRDQAELVFSSYGKTSRAGFVFNLLDGKQLGEKELKKLLYQSVNEADEKE